MRVLAFAAFSDSRAEGFDFAEVAFADLAGAGHDFRDLLEALELDHAAEGEVELVGVHQVEDDDLAAAEAEVLDAVEDFRLVVEQVADDDRDALALDRAGQVVEDLG